MVELSYQPKNKPLDNRKPLRERIFNGDFDYSCYSWPNNIKLNIN